MHDELAFFYEPDTVVEEPDELPPPPPRGRRTTAPPTIGRSRVDTGDLDVIVRLYDYVDGTNDGWHRLAPNGHETACGIRFGMHEEAERRVYRVPEHPLNASCECWTTRERAKADEKYADEYGMPYPQQWKRK